MKTRSIVATGSLLALSACTPGWTGSPEPRATPQPVARGPWNDPGFRVVESATGATVSFTSLIERATRADVVFFGEQHDDPETHFLEFALLEGLGMRQSNVVLSLEMFERDVQQSLDAFLSGSFAESAFLAGARPWPRYATDYRPMVQLARVRGWKVIAANIPRPMASAISRTGMAALDTLTTVERSYASAAMVCTPDTPYFTRFAQAMGDMGGHGPANQTPDEATKRAQLIRVYEAQCAKDETMAESIARELTASRGRGVVMHVNGAFHSDYRQGTVERLRRRMPDLRMLVITAVPVANPSTAIITAERPKADYVIFTRAPGSGR
jgi:uncharacterized iron-regulated protein